MSPIKGQKIKENRKETVVRARMDDEIVAKLDYLVSLDDGLDRSKVLRNGIEIQYKKAKRNKK